MGESCTSPRRGPLSAMVFLSTGPADGADKDFSMKISLSATLYRATKMSRVEECPPGEYDETGDVLTCRKVKNRFGSHTVRPLAPRDSQLWWNKRPGRRSLTGIRSVKSNGNILPDLADLHEAFDPLIRGTLSCDHFSTKLFNRLAKNLNAGFSPGQEIQSAD